MEFSSQDRERTNPAEKKHKGTVEDKIKSLYEHIPMSHVSLHYLET